MIFSREHQNERVEITTVNVSSFWTDYEPNLHSNSHQTIEHEELDVKPNVNAIDIAAFDDIFDTHSNTPLFTSTPIQHASACAANKAEEERQSVGENSGDGSAAALQLSIELAEEERRKSNVSVANNEQYDRQSLGENAVALTEEQQCQLKVAENLKKLATHGTKVVIDDELEFVYDPEQKLVPIQFVPVYQTKSNDLLCGKIPFKENVCFFLHFYTTFL